MTEIAESVRDNKRTTVRAGHGVSKALALDTSILTPSGFKPIKDIHKGDTVYDEDGHATRVVVESPIQAEPCYIVQFDDNSHVIAHAGHLWAVHDFATRKSQRRNTQNIKYSWDKARVVSTAWMAKHVKTKQGQANLSIPTCGMLASSHRIPHPYTTGFWLGDGTRGTSSVTIGNKDAKHILAKIRAEGFKVREVPSQQQEGCKCYCILGLKRKLVEIGINPKKHIPATYITALAWDKVRLIQGYMDADGYKLAHGKSAALGTTDKTLYDSVIPLLASIGDKIHTSTEVMDYKGQDKLVYKFNYKPVYQPFTLPRKMISPSTNRRRNENRYVVSVEPVGEMPVKCISVKSKRKLFLCTEHLIPTHNTYFAARLALSFLYCYPPATVVTTAPTGTQVKDLLWREIRESYENAKIPLFGDLTTQKLDLQPTTGKKYFAIGVATKPDTVTKEATGFQGYHNKHVFIIFDEAAGVMSEIWRAAESLLGTPDHVRFLAIGNATSGVGDFARTFKDPDFNQIQVSVLDTPNYKERRTVIPGVYGREFEERMARKHGRTSDEYAVRVLGGISEKAVLGSYYHKVLSYLEGKGRIGDIGHIPGYQVHAVCDPGYTTPWWFFQVLETGYVHFIRFYEDSGLDMKDYAELFRKYRKDYGYSFGKFFAPFDVDSNAYRIVSGKGLLVEARNAGINFTKLKMETRVTDGITRTKNFLYTTRFDVEGCGVGIDKLRGYHEGINQSMSSEDNIVYTGSPDKDGNEHAADAMRYASKAIKFVSSRTANQLTEEDLMSLNRAYARPR